MSQRGLAQRLLSTVLAALGVIQAGSCYRAEIDLSAYADMVAGSGGITSSAGTQSVPMQAGNGAADVVGGAGGAAEACVDPPLSEWDSSCLITGQKPPVEVCAPQDAQGWRGCYNGGCSVCTRRGELPGYPYYFTWHPCCIANDTCSNHDPFYCNPLCPPPNEHDRVAPCGTNDPNPG